MYKNVLTVLVVKWAVIASIYYVAGRIVGSMADKDIDTAFDAAFTKK